MSLKNIKLKNIFIIFFILIFFIFFSFEEENRYNLQGLINYALEKNKEIAQLDLNIKKAELDLLIAKAKKFPSISLNVSLSYLTNPIGPISVNTGQFGSIPTSNGDILIPPQDMVVFKGMENTLYQFKLTIDQPIFTWGKIDNSIEIYKLLIEAEKIKKEAKISEIKTKIKIYYHSLYYLDKILDALNKQKEIIDRIVEISKQSYEKGFITYSDYLQSAISQKEFDLNFTKIEGERKKAIGELKILLNFPLDKELKIDYSEFDEKLKDQKVLFLNMPDNLWQLAIENNLQLKQISIFKKIVEKQYEIINASNYLKPDIGLRVEISYYGPRFPLFETGWFTQNDYNITISFGISTIIFDSGALKAKIEQAKDEIKKMFVQIDMAYQNLSNLLDSIKIKCEVNKAKLNYYLSKIESDKEIIDKKQNAFKEGLIDEIEYLKIISTFYVNIVSLYLEAIDYYSNYYSIEAICGVEF